MVSAAGLSLQMPAGAIYDRLLVRNGDVQVTRIFNGCPRKPLQGSQQAIGSVQVLMDSTEVQEAPHVKQVQYQL